jgi:hypothetical protein
MIEGEIHADVLLVLPQVAVTVATCEDPLCGTQHWRLTIGWMVWSVHVYF